MTWSASGVGDATGDRFIADVARAATGRLAAGGSCPRVPIGGPRGGHEVRRGHRRGGPDGDAARGFPDPTRADRLRYWDGSQWTEHVSENGGVDADPILGSAAAAPARSAAAPDARARGRPRARPPGRGRAPAPSGGDYPPTILGRAGFGVAAVGGC